MTETEWAERFFSTNAEEISCLVHDRAFNSEKRIKDLHTLLQFLGLTTDGTISEQSAEKLERCPLLESHLTLYEKYKAVSGWHFGRNHYSFANNRQFTSILMEGLRDHTVQLLVAAGAISLMLGVYKAVYEQGSLAWIEGIAILCAVTAILVISAVNQYSQENLFSKLEKKKYVSRVKTVCNGRYDTHLSGDISVGDTLFLEPGDVIAADCILYPEETCACDESLISGESKPVFKGHGKDVFLISGSFILEGCVRALVVSVGKTSTQGQILESIKRDRPRTPLEQKVTRLATSLAYKSIALSLILFFGHAFRLLFMENDPRLEEILYGIVESISIVVMAVPEGLPMAITIALSIGTQRMLKDGLLVRHLAACETMNNATLICTDKTGTLTHNKLSIQLLFANNRFYKFLPNIRSKRDVFSAEELAMKSLKLTVLNGILNSSSFANSKGHFIGSQTEVALLNAVKDSGVDYNFIRKRHKIVHRQPFSSDLKYMSTMVAHGRQYCVFYKGAPERILKACTTAMVENSKVDLETEKVHYFQQKCDSKQIRTLAFCYALVDAPDPKFMVLGSTNCTFLGIVGFEDPLRTEVVENIKICKKSGIIVVMLTGDKSDMAKALAGRIGILEPGQICLTGPEFRSMTDLELERVYNKIRVIARASPADKKKFVEFMQSKGHIVAVTGDGTNDGPALKAADVGFGMGQNGTEIAKAASSIILMNNDFDSITRCIEWGRCINASVRKFIQFQLSVTYSAVITSTVISLYPMHRKPVMNPLTLLWINFIMDTLAVFALSTDRPVEDLIKRTPEPLSEPIITQNMKVFVISAASYLTTSVLSLHYLFRKSHTYILNVYVYMLMASQLNARSLSPYNSIFVGIKKNHAFFYTSIIIFVFQLMITQVFNNVFKTEELRISELFTSGILGFTILPFLEIVRYIRKKLFRKSSTAWRRVSRKIFYETMMLKALEKNARTSDFETCSYDETSSFGKSLAN